MNKIERSLIVEWGVGGIDVVYLVMVLVKGDMYALVGHSANEAVLIHPGQEKMFS